MARYVVVIGREISRQGTICRTVLYLLCLSTRNVQTDVKSCNVVDLGAATHAATAPALRIPSVSRDWPPIAVLRRRVVSTTPAEAVARPDLDALDLSRP